MGEIGAEMTFDVLIAGGALAHPARGLFAGMRIAFFY
jgi:hypothetical protein